MRSDNFWKSAKKHLFQKLYASYSKKEVNNKAMVVKFTNDLLSRNSWIPDSFLNEKFLSLFIKYNTSIPSSEAVERMFL